MTGMKLAIMPALGALASVTLDDKTLIPVGAAVGVIGAVVMLTRRATKWEDAIETNTRMMESAMKRIDNQARDIEELKRVIATRPCLTEKPKQECA